MPNWVFNYLSIEGSKEDIAAVKNQLNRPFTHSIKPIGDLSFGIEKNEYSNPVFAFHNIYNHRDVGITDEEYNKQPVRSLLDTSDPNWWSDTVELSKTDKSWYSWNNQNWGTKWDVAVHNEEKYPDTELTDETDTTLNYHFNTAWAPPIPAIEKLSIQYPALEMELCFEEEQGWGGLFEFFGGVAKEIESYESKCRNCDSNDTIEYCDNGCGAICSECKDLSDSDMECVKECEEHSELTAIN